MRKAFVFFMAVISMVTTSAIAQTTTIDDLENVVYLENSKAIVGSTVTVPVCLNNQALVTNVEFNFTLPKGITIAKDDEGYYLVENGTRANGHLSVPAVKEDGTVYVLCYSPTSRTYNGNNGDVATITFKISDDVKPGVYEITLKDQVITTKDASTIDDIKDITSTITVGTAYTRDVTKGNMGTICLDKDVELADVKGAKMYSIVGKIMNGDTPSSIVAEEVTGKLSAGIPYLFISSEATIEADMYTTEKAVKAGSMNGLVGTFVDTNSIVGMYAISNNKLCKCAAGSKCGANRAYIDMEKVPLYNSASEVSGKRISIDISSDPTSIQAIAGNDNAAETYSINGMRINGDTKGVQIIKTKNGVVKVLK